MGLFDALRKRAPVTTPKLFQSAAPPVPPVRSTWLQLPTLLPGGDVEVVGESHYQAALEAVSGGRTQHGAQRPYCTAQLVREPKNPHDPNAVRVDIDGRPVGYIARSKAPHLHPIIEALRSQGKQTTCRAMITGGWHRSITDVGSFGVVLDIATPLQLCPTDYPLLRDATQVSVVNEKAFQDTLVPLIGASVRHMATLSTADRVVIDVYVSGHQIGSLSSVMSARYLPMVLEAWDAGLAPSCVVTLSKGAKNIEAHVGLPIMRDNR